MNVFLATEDELSEVIAEKLLREAHSEISTINKLRRGGFGYLRSKMDSWRQLATQFPVFVFTDLDAVECAPSLIKKWCGDQPLPNGLHIRIAVREVESWLLADKHAVRTLIGPKGQIPTAPDELNDPKIELLRLAKKAPRTIRLDLVQEQSNNLKQGLGYNARLVPFVQDTWNPERAAENSPSLKRTRIRLRNIFSQQ